MSGIKRFIFFSFFLFSITNFLKAQEVRFYAEAETNEVPLDGYFEVYFKIENGNGVDLSPPTFSDFKVLGPPTFSSQTSIINGEASRSSSYTFALEPTRKGRFTIGPATVKVNGKIFTSKPITLEVLDGKSDAKLTDEIQNGGDVFARMEISSEVAYPGQQITLEYKIYSRLDVSSFNFNSESKYTGIYVKPFKNFDGGVKVKSFGGQRYMVRTLRKLALFPQQSGKMVIDPAILTVGIPMDNDDPFGSLFSSSKPKQLRTNSLQFEVRPLPTPIPDGFLGAVGNFEYSVSSDKVELTTDDAAMLNFKISGNGDMKKIQTPSLSTDSIFDYYPAEVLEDTEQESSGQWTGIKSYVIDLTPKKPGKYNIDIPPFVYFDPKTKEYKTIAPEPLPLVVSQGLNKADSQSDEAELVKEVSYFQKNRNIILVTAGSLALLAFIAFLFRPSTKKEHNNLTGTEPKGAEAKIDILESDQALKIPPKETNVNELLREAENLKINENWKEFFKSLNETLGSFLSEKLEIPFSKFSINSVIDKLKELELSNEFIEETRQIMQKLEGAVYARFIDQNTANEMLESVRNVMHKLK
ncbi:MAG: BatD family protein [Saprospiraceae bacterium]|nr:BatD family protein [Candidatus Brachybacter algidus]MBL0119889.1 protein BatD [Candidatus Brachybacter algidus]